MNKKIKCFFIVTAMLFTAVLPTSFSYIHASEDENKAVEYLPEYGGYLLTNITADEVLDSFENSGFKPINTRCDTGVTNDFKTKANMVRENYELAEATASSTYRQDYVLTIYVKGVYGENVAVNYTANMNMTSFKINNKQYAQFVSVYLGPTHWLGTNSYEFTSSGTVEPTAEILNGGATLRVNHTFQLETTTTYSSNTGSSFGWFNFGSTAGGYYYKRTASKTYSPVYNLPLLDIVM